MERQVVYFDRCPRITGAFSTGVSLHSHTLHSKESVLPLGRQLQASVLARTLVNRAHRRYGVNPLDEDLSQTWWTPPLARAYADVDIFLFPSRTDTGGNVIWEAEASGVPSVVTNSGGPRFIVRDGQTGLVSRSDGEFVENAIALHRDRVRRSWMGQVARDRALLQSWDAVFDRLYSEAYARAVAR